MSAAEIDQLRARVRGLCDLVSKVHKAKGRNQKQIAMCDLYDAVGLENVRPGSPGSPVAQAPAYIHTGNPIEGAADPLYSEAVALVLSHNKGSISLVQRHLRISFNRAAIMLEAMMMAGIVSPLPAGGYSVVPECERNRTDDTEGGAA